MCKLYHILIILFLTGIAVTIYGCSGKDSQNVRTVREQKSESVSQAEQTAPLASEGKAELPIIDELACDMVQIETDSGSFYI